MAFIGLRFRCSRHGQHPFSWAELFLRETLFRLRKWRVYPPPRAGTEGRDGRAACGQPHGGAHRSPSLLLRNLTSTLDQKSARVPLPDTTASEISATRRIQLSPTSCLASSPGDPEPLGPRKSRSSRLLSYPNFRSYSGYGSVPISTASASRSLLRSLA